MSGEGPGEKRIGAPGYGEGVREEDRGLQFPEVEDLPEPQRLPVAVEDEHPGRKGLRVGIPGGGSP